MSDESRRIGPCRCMLSAKPLMQLPEPGFFRCTECGAVFCDWTGKAKAPACCGAEMQRLIPQDAETLVQSGALRYDVVGGFNENCIRVFWSGETPSWLYLLTYTGGQYMQLSAKKRSPAVFALAGEDAYAYCDKDPCEMCSFRCKNGFVLYACCDGALYAVPVNRIAATSGSPGSRAGRTQ